MANTPEYRSPTASGGSELMGYFGPTSLPPVGASPSKAGLSKVKRKKRALGKVARRGNMTKRSKY